MARGFHMGGAGGEMPFIPYEIDISYTGYIQRVDIPYKGLYKLEVWGAKGGDAYSVAVGGNGGYSVGYKVFEQGQTLFIVCGGVGSKPPITTNAITSGGYNGGGNAQNDGADYKPGSGGGATHIGTENKLLTAYTLAEFDTEGKGLIIAGGGGGGWVRHNQYPNYATNGGAGGGTGTLLSSTFGQGGNGSATGLNCGAGGGGGYYGGAGRYGNGGGGSGFIGNMPQITYKGVIYTPSTTDGVNNTNGKAKITRIA